MFDPLPDSPQERLLPDPKDFPPLIVVGDFYQLIPCIIADREPHPGSSHI
jgi:hypothetical protein